MRIKTGIIIRKLIFIISAIVCIYSCVDTIPLPDEDGERKLFVVCEMTVGAKIFSDVTYTGNTSGGLNPSVLMKPDTFNFAIAEGDKDFGVPFTFDKGEKRFVINKESLPLTTGQKYKFRGIGANKNSSEPAVIIPEAVIIDTIIIEKVSRNIIQNKYFTEVNCRIRLKTPINTIAYFHIVPKTENQGNWVVKNIINDQSAFKRLRHRPGLLVDYARLSNDEISLTLEITEEKETKTVDMDIFNTTISYYQYNYYMSNITSDSYGQNSEIPAITGFNIKTDKAFGTFSAKTLTKKTVNIK